MVALSTLGWSVIDWSRYRNPHLHNPRAAFVFIVTIIVTMKICGLVCIWYYYQGRSWARMAVLLTSALDDILSASARSRERGVPQPYCERSTPWAFLSLLVEHSHTSQIFPVRATSHQVTKSDPVGAASEGCPCRDRQVSTGHHSPSSRSRGSSLKSRSRYLCGLARNRLYN
jgi:hypothetical protein